MVIWKQQLAVTDRLTATMPKGSKILSVQMQNGEPCVWFMCDPGRPKVARVMGIYGTGHPLPQRPVEYVNTIQMGALVWHVFDLGEIE